MSSLLWRSREDFSSNNTIELTILTLSLLTPKASKEHFIFSGLSLYLQQGGEEEAELSGQLL
jgi:hypothetical protein